MVRVVAKRLIASMETQITCHIICLKSSLLGKLGSTMNLTPTKNKTP